MLHPQAKALLRLMEEKGVPPTHTLTPAQARAAYRERRTFTQPDPPDVGAVRDLEARGPAGPVACTSRTDATSGGSGCVKVRRSR